MIVLFFGLLLFGGIESESREEDPEFSSAWNLIPTLSVPTGIFFSCSYSCPSFIFLIFSSSLFFWVGHINVEKAWGLGYTGKGFFILFEESFSLVSHHSQMTNDILIFSFFSFFFSSLSQGVTLGFGFSAPDLNHREIWGRLSPQVISFSFWFSLFLSLSLSLSFSLLFSFLPHLFVFAQSEIFSGSGHETETTSIIAVAVANAFNGVCSRGVAYQALYSMVGLQKTVSSSLSLSSLSFLPFFFL